MFNRKELIIKPLAKRTHDIDLSSVMPVRERKGRHEPFLPIASCIVEAKKRESSILLIAGGHVIRSGVQRYIIDLLESGYLSCLSMNGSGLVHDYEFALIGATTESVARYIREGQFGLWKETGKINDIVNDAYLDNKDSGLGRAVGRYIYDKDLPYKDISLLAACYRLDVPCTIHIGIGYDIIHEHPNFDGAAAGALSYNDFLIFAENVSDIEGGVVMNFGSAVMAPEVFLKALSMARNVAHKKGYEIKHFTTLVCDLHDLPDDYTKEPPKASPAYFFRPWKTMLVRTVADGGKSYYVKGRHEENIPALWTAIKERTKLF